MTQYLFVVMFIVFSVTGCAAQQGPIVTIDPAAPCEEIVPSSLLTVPFDDLAEGREQTEEWILTQFPTSTVNFEAIQTNGATKRERYSWWAGDKLVTLFLGDEALYARHIYKRFPTLGHVIRCFGKPTYYILASTYIGGEVPSGVLLELWYLDQGLYFDSVTWGRSEIRRYDVNSPLVGQVKVMPAGTVEQMRQQGNISTEMYINKAQAVPKKWPDNFTALVLGD